jgi:hypothetical protein
MFIKIVNSPGVITEMTMVGIYAQDINPDGQLGNSIVPVELVSFSANVSNNSVELNWITATELNNSGFEIERSKKREARSEIWENIGFVNGNGTTCRITLIFFY